MKQLSEVLADMFAELGIDDARPAGTGSAGNKVASSLYALREETEAARLPGSRQGKRGTGMGNKKAGRSRNSALPQLPAMSQGGVWPLHGGGIRLVVNNRTHRATKRRARLVLVSSR